MGPTRWLLDHYIVRLDIGMHHASGMKESESTQQIECNVPQCVCSQQRGNMFMHCWIQTLVTETAMQERPLFLSCMQESNCACDPESSRVVSQHLV